MRRSFTCSGSLVCQSLRAAGEGGRHGKTDPLAPRDPIVPVRLRKITLDLTAVEVRRLIDALEADAAWLGDTGDTLSELAADALLGRAAQLREALR